MLEYHDCDCWDNYIMPPRSCRKCRGKGFVAVEVDDLHILPPLEKTKPDDNSGV